MADILFTEVTTGVLTGDGAFDKLMRSVKAHLAEEYAASRIKGSDYATVYLGSIQSAISQSLQFVLQAPISSGAADKSQAEVNLLEQKFFTEEAQIKDTVNGALVAGAIGKQKALYSAQTEGFTRDAEQKASQIFSNLASVIYSTDPNALNPSNAGFGEASIRSMLTKLATGINVNI